MTDENQPLPHAPIAEKSILSAMFQNVANIARAASEGVTADVFHIPSHRELVGYLIKARESGAVEDDGSASLTVLVQQAAIDGNLDRMGGAAEIYEIYNYAPSLAGWSSWCGQVRECNARRIATLAAETISSANDSEEAIKALTDALDATKRAVTARTRSINAKAACDEFIAAYIASHSNGELPGISTGIDEVDAITGGAKPGELWVVGGPSSSGKSVLMYQVESEFLGNGRIVANFSAELMAREIVGRLVTLRARVTYDAVTTPQGITKDQMRKIQRGIEEMAQTKMWIDASAGQSLDSIASECERIRDIEGRIDLIVVDYIQIIKGIRGKGDSREQEIASISGGLKQLAKKMECTVITGTQLNDNGQTRESRAIEQDADVLMVIQDGGILMKKVRNGARSEVINLALDGAQQRFRYFQSQ